MGPKDQEPEEDQGTRRLGDQSTRDQDQGTRGQGPRDQRTRGPEDQGTRGPEDQNRRKSPKGELNQGGAKPWKKKHGPTKDTTRKTQENTARYIIR